ncbi:hypothetical protein M0R45_036368 [Rubus argutus]|uniref:Wall-associated receptor kinase galacturonan-binding domain-containing protein n=1 Tax=Rubus argutus TaxID=59490 RepID=A0AAW1VZE9_RUBAR
MIRRSLPIPVRFIVPVVLGLFYVACHAKDHHCEPSSCGDIRNISYPFRLTDDPDKCGVLRYNLSCENNLTVLHLYSGKYYVRAINYENYTIRVMDANVREDNCTSIPRYSLASYNFSYEDPYSMFLKRAIQTSRERLHLSKAIIFISCETQLVNSPRYVDTAPCIDAASRHSFVIIGSLKVSDLRDSCRIELMVLTSSWIGTNSSYIDIHNMLLYGFELSWAQILDCYVDIDTNKVRCYDRTMPYLEGDNNLNLFVFRAL